jgi:hypothetical protein
MSLATIHLGKSLQLVSPGQVLEEIQIEEIQIEDPFNEL